MFSVGFPWQIQSPARQSGESWRAGSGVTSATGATSVLCPSAWPGRAGRAALLPGPFSSPQWALPLPKRPILASERQEGRARVARDGQRCPAWRGPASCCHPAHRHGNRCGCISKVPEAQPRVPGQGPARDTPAALPLSGVGRSPPDRPSPAPSVGEQELALEVTAWKSHSGSFFTLTRGSQIGERWP